jgi:hypothetical protein
MARRFPPPWTVIELEGAALVLPAEAASPQVADVPGRWL